MLEDSAFLVQYIEIFVSRTFALPAQQHLQFLHALHNLLEIPMFPVFTRAWNQPNYRRGRSLERDNTTCHRRVPVGFVDVPGFSRLPTPLASQLISYQWSTSCFPISESLMSEGKAALQKHLCSITQAQFVA
jgi:hypothetical protein